MRAEEVSRTTRPAAKHQDASEHGGNDTLTLRLTLLPRNDIGNAERLETLSRDLFESGLLKPHPVIPALTLHQPWASLMAWGLKTVETRGWGTRAIENLAIYAAAQWHGHALEACRENVATAKALASRRLTPEDLPRGKVLAVVDLVGCRQVRPDDALHWVPAAELSLGNYGVGRYGWITDRLRPLETSIPVRRARRLWNWRIPEGVRIPGVTA